MPFCSTYSDMSYDSLLSELFRESRGGNGAPVRPGLHCRHNPLFFSGLRVSVSSVVSSSSVSLLTPALLPSLPWLVPPQCLDEDGCHPDRDRQWSKGKTMGNRWPGHRPQATAAPGRPAGRTGRANTRSTPAASAATSAEVVKAVRLPHASQIAPNAKLEASAAIPTDML